jgi:pimeloyl-ACP methyl ester carboxylesterase
MSTRDEALEIAVGDHHIDGTLIVPDTRMPGVLFLHGWGGNQTQYAARAREIAALGCACLTVDMRGHAKREREQATVTREDNLNDVLAAYDRLCEEGAVADDQIAVVGSSYGGYLATLLTALRPVRWLALRAPALYKDTDWGLPKLKLRQVQDLEAYRRRALATNANRALRAAAAFRGDVLIVESGRDSVIPSEVIENYRNALSAARSLTYRAIDGADHGLTDPAWRAAYTTLLVNWITEMMAGARVEDVHARKHRQDVMKTQATAKAD